MRVAAALLVSLWAVSCGASAPLSSDAGRDPANGTDAAAEAPDAKHPTPDALAADVQTTDVPGAPDDDATCCPIDPSPTSCLNGGGSNQNGCFETCDFWCSFNWRVERDDKGCPIWRMDYRQPAPGENMRCEPDPDAGRDAAAEE